jgi:cytidine deaminase
VTARKLSAIRTKPSAGRTKPHGAKAGTATVATAPSTELDRELTRLARAAQDRAYAPYSHFRVGAALVTADGQVFTGANIENASYGLTVCAERNAVAAMVMAGARDLRAIYVASDIAPPASPCGMCRQTLLEFARDPASTGVIAIGPGDSRQSWTLAALLPSGFTGDQLARRR